MAKAVIELTNTFEDSSTRKLELGPLAVEDADVDVIRNRIRNFDAGEISQLYLSDAGANFVGISAAKVIVSEEREINLN